MEKTSTNFVDETIKTSLNPANYQKENSNYNYNYYQTPNNRSYAYSSNANRNDFINRTGNSSSALHMNQNIIGNTNDENKDLNRMKKLQLNFYRDDMALNLSLKNVFYIFFKKPNKQIRNF